MRGKAKIERINGKYRVFTRNFFWQSWKELRGNDGNIVEFASFKDFSKVTRIDSFDRVIIKLDKYSGYRGE